MTTVKQTVDEALLKLEVLEKIKKCELEICYIREDKERGFTYLTLRNRKDA